MKYSESNINEKILRSLEEMGFEDMTPIQELAIPVLQTGKDIIGQAQTGTGKTAAFGIPMIEKMNPKAGGVQGLVLCPTRELAIQAAEELKKMSKHVPGVKVAAIYGGQDIMRQFKTLRERISIVVGTPGRVMDHMRRGTLSFNHLRMLVLDEADEMLNMGFREDIEAICDELPEDRQTALFSATMPDEIMEIADEYQKDAQHIKVKSEEVTVSLVAQSYYVVKGREKDASLCRLLDYMSPKRALIFCNTKRKVDELTLLLKAKEYSAEALHGDLSQHQRDRVMNLFRNGNLELLLATDVAARGIDVDDVDMVFNYDMPQDMEYYVHRIGRTGRAGRTGKAVSLITSREKYKIDSLEDYCNTRIKRGDMPTAGAALTVKAYGNVKRAMEFCGEEELTPYMKMVYKRCMEADMDPLEIAAAFLRMSLGDIDKEAMDEIHGKKANERAKLDRRVARDKNGGEGEGGENRGEGRSEGRGDRRDKRDSHPEKKKERRNERRKEKAKKAQAKAAKKEKKSKKAKKK